LIFMTSWHLYVSPYAVEVELFLLALVVVE
jgi:hypothetical protein